MKFASWLYSSQRKGPLPTIVRVGSKALPVSRGMMCMLKMSANRQRTRANGNSVNVIVRSSGVSIAWMKSSCPAFGAGSCPSRPRKRLTEKRTSSESTTRLTGAVNFALGTSVMLNWSRPGVNSHDSTRSPVISGFGTSSKAAGVCLNSML